MARHEHKPPAQAAAARQPSPPRRAAPEQPSRPPRRSARPERPTPPPSRIAHRAPASSAPLTGPGTIVQLGAFSTEARAERAWLSLAQVRHLSRFPHRVERAQVHGRTVYRLRVLVSGRMGDCGRRARCVVVRQWR
jgi:cell division septation protein DedD